MGYIRLPKFYMSFDGDKGHNCADDVKAEIEKLKADSVNGIVLDLRNNGGGSLQGVIDIVGLFIEEGPVVQVKAPNRAPKVLADDDDDIHYDGPLVVMVNQFSASASEIFAAAIQDYQPAALVIGSRSTFGKGTVQNVLDMGR
ncbi:MAG: S41 family peptidase [Owenweeksia sp.]|nr:S41 family peptidase [Owenweeksia sp.]